MGEAYAKRGLEQFHIWTPNPSLSPNTSPIPNAISPSRAPVVADVCEIAVRLHRFLVPFSSFNSLAATTRSKVSVTCAGGDGVNCASIPPRTTDCDVQLFFAYKVMNVGMDSFDVTFLQVSHRVIDGPQAGEDCHALKANAGSTAVNGTSGCLVDVEYIYELSNIGIADLTITRFVSVLNGDPQQLLRGPKLEETVLSPTEILIANRIETLDTCKDVQYITTGAVNAESTDGQECGDVADSAFDIVPSESA